MAGPALNVQVLANLDALRAAFSAPGGMGDVIQTTTRQLAAASAAFDGSKIISQANAAVAAIGSVAQVSTLTAAEQDKLNTTLSAAIDKYTALGKTAPAAMVALEEATQGANEATNLFSSTFTQLASAFTAAGLITSAVTSLVALGQSAIESAGRLVDMSVKTGLSLDTLQRFEFIAGQTGTTLDELSQAVFKLGVNVEKGGKPVNDALQALGLNIDYIKGLSPDQEFSAIATALSNMSDVQERNRLGVDLMGKSYGTVAAAIAQYGTLADGASTATDRSLESVKAADDAWAAFEQHLSAGIAETAGRLVEGAERWVTWIAAVDQAIGYGTQITSVLADETAGLAAATTKLQDHALALQVAVQLMGDFGPKTAFTNQTLATFAANSQMATWGGQSLRSALDDLNARIQAQHDLLALLSPEIQQHIVYLVQQGASVEEVAAAYKDLALTPADIEMIVKASKDAAEAAKQHAEAAKQAQAETDAWVNSVREAIDAGEKYQAELDKTAQFNPAIATQQWLDQYNKELEQAAAYQSEFGAKRAAEMQKETDDWIAETRRQIDAGEQFQAEFAAKLTQLHVDTLKHDIDDASIAFSLLAQSGVAALAEIGQAGLGVLAIVQKLATSGAFTFGPNGLQFNQNLLGGLSMTAGGAIAGAGAIQSGNVVGGVEAGASTGAGLAMMGGWGLGAGIASMGIGAAAVGIGALISHFANQSAGRDAVTQYAQSQGGFDALHQQLDQLTTEGVADGEQLWIALTQGVGKNNPQQAQIAIDNINAALAKGAAAVQTTTANLNTLTSTLDTLGAKGADDLAPLLQNLINAGQTKEAQADIDSLTGAITAYQTALANQSAWKAAQSAMQAVGLTADDMNAKFQQGAVEDSADTIAQQWQALAPYVNDVNGLADKYLGSMENMIHLQATAGVAIPDSMKPIMQSLIDQGQLLDDNGQKITDISQINFEQDPVTAAFNALNDSIQTLIDTLNKDLAPAIANIGPTAQTAADQFHTAFDGLPSDVTTRTELTMPDGSTVDITPHAAAGGYFPAQPGGTLVRLAEGGEGEYVIPESKMGRRAPGLGGGSSQPIQLHVHIPGQREWVVDVTADAMARGEIVVPSRAISSRTPRH